MARPMHARFCATVLRVGCRERNAGRHPTVLVRDHAWVPSSPELRDLLQRNDAIIVDAVRYT